MLIDLVPAATVQSGLFDRSDDTRSTSRMQALDALNSKYGSVWATCTCERLIFAMMFRNCKGVICCHPNRVEYAVYDRSPYRLNVCQPRPRNRFSG